MGRPTLYDPKRTPQIAKALAREGRTDIEIAELLGIAEKCFYNWRKRYPAFVQALTAGKQATDDSVENALLRRALGYEYDEERPVQGQVVTMKKHVPPDTTACIFWLKNRRPGAWRDKHEVTGEDGGPLTLIVRGVGDGK